MYMSLQKQKTPKGSSPWVSAIALSLEGQEDFFEVRGNTLRAST